MIMARGNPERKSLEDWRLRWLPRRNVDTYGGPTNGFLYRPRQLLVAEDADEAIREIPLARDWPQPRRVENTPVLQYTFEDPIEIPHLVRLIRHEGESFGRPLRAGPNLVFTGEQAYQGCPGGWPRPAPRPDSDFEADDRSRRPVVAVFDTGYTDGIHDSLDRRIGGPESPPRQEDVDTRPTDGWRDFEAGHATFILGIIAGEARCADLRMVSVLDSEGYVDEVELLTAIKQLTENADIDILNLSLGGFSFADARPVALEHALGALGDRTLVLAAAGNASEKGGRPFWPAHLQKGPDVDQKVIFSVGATTEGGEIAGYSNEPADFYTSGWAESAFIEIDETSKHGSDVDGRRPQTFEGFASWEGTSFATPKVAAMIAELMCEEGLDARAAARELFARGESLGEGRLV